MRLDHTMPIDATLLRQRAAHPHSEPEGAILRMRSLTVYGKRQKLAEGEKLLRVIRKSSKTPTVDRQRQVIGKVDAGGRAGSVQRSILHRIRVG